MTGFRLSPLTPLLALLAAVPAGMLAFGSAPATAATGPHYRAELASPAPQARFVARDVVWTCDGTNCTAARGTSRPAIMCASLAKAAGPVSSFAAGGKTLDAAELARCNGTD